MNYYDVNKFSASAAKVLMSGLSPYAAFHRIRTPFSPTESMKLGTIVHAIIECGGTLPKAVAAVSPYSSYQTGEAKAFKAWWEGDPKFADKLPKKGYSSAYESLMDNIDALSYSKEHGAILTDDETIEKATKMAMNVLAVVDTRGGEHEQEFYTDDSKARIDFIASDGVIWDWKTTSITKAKDVFWECKKWGLDIQAAQYVKLTGLHKFNFAFVCSTEPFEVFVAECSPSYIAEGMCKLAKAKELWDLYKDAPLDEIPKATTIELSCAKEDKEDDLPW